MTDPAADLVRQYIDRNRTMAKKYADAAYTRRVKATLQAAEKELVARIDAAVKLGRNDTFEAVQAQAALRQLRDTLKGVNAAIAGTVVDTGKVVAETTAKTTVDFLTKSERKYHGMAAASALRLDEAAVLDRAVSGYQSSQLYRLRGSGEPGAEVTAPHRGKPGILQRYDDGVLAKFEEQLRTHYLARRPWAETRDAIIQQSPFLTGKEPGVAATWAERILRTETAYANNRANWQTMNEANEQLGDGVKILCATFDDRAAADSYAVHGQIRRLTEPFDTWTGSFMHPPARPNDREVVVPHRLSWPVPDELKPKTDAEVAARWRYEKRKGSPPARPKLSTIPPDQFGKPQPPVGAPPGTPPTESPVSPEEAEARLAAMTQRGMIDSPFGTPMDEDSAHLARPDIVRQIHAGIEDAPIQQVTLDRLFSDRTTIEADSVRPFIRDPHLVRVGQRSATGALEDLPVIVRHQGMLFVYDGDHRLAADKLRGLRRTVARVVDLDKGKTPPTPPTKPTPTPPTPPTPPPKTTTPTTPPPPQPTKPTPPTAPTPPPAPAPKPAGKADPALAHPSRPEHTPEHHIADVSAVHGYTSAGMNVAYGRAMLERGVDMHAHVLTQHVENFARSVTMSGASSGAARSIQRVTHLLRKHGAKSIRDLIEMIERPGSGIVADIDELRAVAALGSHLERITRRSTPERFGTAKVSKVKAGRTTRDAATPEERARAISRAEEFIHAMVDETVAVSPSGAMPALTFTGSRGCYRTYFNAIEASNRMGVLEHELGHALEAGNDTLRASARAWLANRTKGEKATWLGAGYRRNEKSRRDKFLSKYVGKEYSDATEVTSMGLEYIVNDLVWFARGDPDHYHFILGQLAGGKVPDPPPAPPKAPAPKKPRAPRKSKTKPTPEPEPTAE